MTPSLTPDPASWRVLALDDRPDNLKLIETLLRSWSVTSVVTNDPHRALELVHEFQPNLILLDLAIPGLSGWEVHRQMRLQPELDDVPIIAVTALARQEDINRGKEAGLDGYITKPYRVDDLQSQLVTYIQAFIQRRAEKKP
jgi:two-component system, cell cycle response regulator DivK